MDSSSDGVGFVSLLQLVFITLKLTGYITWSWWWVLSPFLISFLIGLGILVFGLALAGLFLVLEQLIQ